jgi:hypothetical protein
LLLNISRDEIREDEKTVPALTGRPTAAVTKWDTAMIAGLDADGNVWSVWFSTQNAEDGWQASPLSKISGAGAMTGNISIYLTDWNGINVAGLNEAGETTVIWWVPSFKGDWEVTNLTEKFDGPAFKAGTMTTYTTPWNALTVIGITADSRMVAYWWAPGFDKWTVSDFSKFLPSQHPRVVRGPIEAVVRESGDIWLFGRNHAGDMIRVFWAHSRDTWSSKVLNTDAKQF